MEIFKKLKYRVESKTNGNFNFEKLNWITQYWIQALCNLIDEQKQDKPVSNSSSGYVENLAYPYFAKNKGGNVYLVMKGCYNSGDGTTEDFLSVGDIERLQKELAELSI